VKPITINTYAIIIREKEINLMCDNPENVLCGLGYQIQNAIVENDEASFIGDELMEWDTISTLLLQNAVMNLGLKLSDIFEANVGNVKSNDVKIELLPVQLRAIKCANEAVEQLTKSAEIFNSILTGMRCRLGEDDICQSCGGKIDHRFTCDICGNELTNGSGCKPSVFVGKDGKEYPAIKFGEDRGWEGHTGYCPECGCAAGDYHHENCDIEQCPICGNLAALCGCKREYRNE
jgi:hypothetical protein